MIFRASSAALLGAVCVLCAGCENRVEKMQSPDRSVREKVFESLGKNASAAEVRQLCDLLLHHKDDGVRADCAMVLGYRKAPSSVPSLIEALGDRQWYVRRGAVDSLRIIGDERANGPLLAMLSDKEIDVYTAAARAFGRFRNPAAVPLLIALLKFENPSRQAYIDDTNRAAVAALGVQKDRKALEPLSRLLNAPDETTARTAAQAIGEIVGQDFTEEVQVESFMLMRLGSPTKAKAWWAAHGAEEAKESE